MPSPTSRLLRLGLTMWSHSGWQSEFYGKGTQSSERLAKYASVFSTVEGNTTFYASPSAHTVLNWHDATPDEFRFTFKLPKQITHQNALRHSQQDVADFLQLMSPLAEKIGMWTIQLPANFGPDDFVALVQFCQQFPRDIPLGVEVRHPAFFAKQDAEKQLNQWLLEQGINRIIMDSRPVFAAKADNEVIIDAQKKKPRVPVHAIATAHSPMIRFIGHPELDANLEFFAPWLSKLPAWIAQGKQPYLMIHTPDNVLAPQLAVKLYQQLQTQLDLTTLPSFPAAVDQQQLSMF
ncbi:DUF72 domain-containing protein [Vibrio sp. CAIM 722]|uniref:DUF72 domain-containing protein n=1 Tax=Vibrio eleionomae TaxID=2653505 RepID=A0A7X4LNK0_9VIBR|nr:DUF72 domain-containing protein [Vibrio eleionomae]MZI95194.1 DUF72 domain-containing protein [Vibrio eleionomae]